MSGTYLPGDTRQRIQDLIKDSSITQAELAGIIGLSESAFSRYLKGQTEMLGDGYIIKIAKHFKVSTDFLLGETDIPDRKNYDIEELGFETQKLNHRVNVLRRYLETERADNEKLNDLVKKLNKELDDANYEINNLERDLRKSRIRQNQRTFSLENRLDIAYTKLAQLKYTLNEFEDLGFLDRIRGKKPKSFDDIDK